MSLNNIQSDKMVERVNIAEYGYTVLQIETKSTCNMKCEFCPYPIREDKNGEMPEEIVYKIIDSIDPDDSFEYICFSQFNEPLMDRRIFDFISYAKKKGLPVLLISNGLLFRSKEKIDNLVESAPDLVKISLQTINEEMFRHARGVTSSFDKYITWIYDYLRAVADKNSVINIDVACNFQSFRKSIKSKLFGLDAGDPSVYNDIPDLADDLKQFIKGWEKIYDNFAFNESEYEKFLSNLSAHYKEQEAFSIAPNIHIKIKQFMYGRRLRDFYPLKVSDGCNNRILGILASGNVVPCCLSYGDKLRMGNVVTQSLPEALRQNNKLISSIRTGNNMPSTCMSCLGAPSKRGALAKSVKAQLNRMRRSSR